MMRYAVLILMFLVWARSAHGAEGRYAVIIGNNVGNAGSAPLKYATQDAKKIHSLLRSNGGFDAANTGLLLNKDANEVWPFLRKMEQRAQKYKDRTGQKTIMLIYYSGHGDPAGLELNNTRLSFSELRRFLKTSASDVRLAFVDSCHSGKLIASKGISRAKAYKIEVDDAIDARGYAIITSSSPNELSQELTELRGAFFTHHLVSALRGSGDTSNDGMVTLQEAYRYVYAKTLSQSTATIGSGQHPMYHFALHGQGDIVLTRTRASDARILLPFKEAGRVLLQDAAGTTILAETSTKPRTPVQLTVPPGNYRIYFINEQHAVRMAKVSVHSGANDIAAELFHLTELTSTVARGGLFPSPEYQWSHKLGLGAQWRSGHLVDMERSLGGAIYYRLEHSSGWQPELTFAMSMADDAGVSTGYRDLGVTAGMAHIYYIHHLGLRSGMSVTLEHMFQAPNKHVSRDTTAVAAAICAGLQLRSGRMLISADGALKLRSFQIVNKGWVYRMGFQLLLSTAWRFGR